MLPSSCRPLWFALCLVAFAALLTPNATARPDTPSGKVAPPVTLPADPIGMRAPGPMGSAVDAPAPYQPQTMCAATARAGVVKLRALALSTYGRGGSSPATPRACASGSGSEHKDGRAWDWMLDHADRKDRKTAANFLSWITADNGEMASRLGIMYVIYNRKIWASYAPGWRDYSGADPHTSHIHISLSWNGARAHTSFWTGRTWALDYGSCQAFAGQPGVLTTKRPRTEPCATPAATPQVTDQPMLWLGSTGKAVRQAQRLLGVTRSGTFDIATRRATLTYQSSHELPRTGAVDDPTWASLLPSSIKASKPTWTPTAGARWAERRGYPEVRVRDAGRRVYALQCALRLPQSMRTSYYGAATKDAVIAAKADLGLARTPRATPELWAALPLATPAG